jgi:membrane-associated phospholipid phosphatase
MQKIKNSHFTFIICLEIIVGIFLIVGTLKLFLDLGTTVLKNEVFFFDTAITEYIYAFRSPTNTVIMNAITFFGGEFILAATIMIAIVFVVEKHKKYALLFSFILFFGIAINLLLKDFFHRYRPSLNPLVYEASYSFPSAHAMNSFIFYTAISYLVTRKIKNKILEYSCMLLAILAILAIGLSRIYLGAHFPSDVIAGYLAGFCWFVTVLVLEKTIYFFQVSKVLFRHRSR